MSEHDLFMFSSILSQHVAKNYWPPNRSIKRKGDGWNPAGASRFFFFFFFFFKDLCYVFILPQFEYIHWKIEALKR